MHMAAAGHLGLSSSLLTPLERCTRTILEYLRLAALARDRLTMHVYPKSTITERSWEVKKRERERARRGNVELLILVPDIGAW